MAEVTAFRNNALPYPVYGAPWAIVAPLLDADGDPVSPSSPDSEVSLNGNTFADCTNEQVEIATSSGVVYLLLTAAEMTADIVTVQLKSTGAKTTIITLYPRKLVSIRAGTSASAGSATSTIVLDASASLVDDYYNGMICVAVIDTLTEVRMISDYTGSTQTATVVPDWNVAPDNNDTFTIYRPDGTQIAQADLRACAGLAYTSGAIPAAVAGAAGGLFIAGSNAATTTASLTTGAIAATTITASGAVAFQSTFAVTTSTALGAISGSTLTLSGAVAFQSTFAVTTSTSLAALSATTVTFSGAVAFQSTFAVTTSTSLAALSCTTFAASGTVTYNAFTVTNAFLVSGTTTHTGAVSFGSTFGVTGTVTFNALTVTNNLLVSGTTTHTGAVTWTAGGTLNTVTATVSTVTTVTTATNVTTVNGLAANVITAAATAADFGGEVADAVWDEAIAGHLGAGSTGAALSAAGGAGDPWTTTLPGSYIAGQAGYIVGTYLDALITSRMATYTQPTGFLAATFPGTVASTTNITAGIITTVTNLTNAPTAGDFTNTMKTSIGTAVAASAVASVTGNVGGNVTGSIGSLATQAKADVNAEVIDVMATDTHVEQGQGSPAATASYAVMLGFVYKSWRNLSTQTATEYALYADNGTTKDQEAVVSDDGTTFSRGKVTTGA